MNYQNVKGFMESVKNNDVFSIKSDLEGIIVLFKADKIKCDEAVGATRFVMKSYDMLKVA
ncbi:MAG: hypothetical protein ACRC6U_05070 [Fusobacteriaceae bacterium]